MSEVPEKRGWKTWNRAGRAAEVPKAYMEEHIEFGDLLERIPEETLWMKENALSQMERVRGKKNVLLVLGWCPLRDKVVDLDEAPHKACLTEQLVMCVESITRRPVLFVDFFKDCKRASNDYGCDGSDEKPTENTIHSLALLVELTVATREYRIKFCGVWGFAKLFPEYIDQAVFAKLPAFQNLPRAYNPYHIGKLYDVRGPRRKALALGILETLSTVVVGFDKFSLYQDMKEWFDARKLSFRLPELELQYNSRIADKIEDLFAEVTLDDIEDLKPPPRSPSPPFWDSVTRDKEVRERRKRKWEEFEWVPGLEEPEPGVPQWMKDQDAEDEARKQLARDMPYHPW
ncbi:hypothetical protein DL95DRAFT_468435 [Leptodontidium sp. 2 PMI_412]|nr:hypothetical protein DL95DRAFT_468435 [Leptodontidium sp. 2 PMI_412]